MEEAGKQQSNRQSKRQQGNKEEPSEENEEDDEEEEFGMSNSVLEVLEGSAYVQKVFVRDAATQVCRICLDASAKLAASQPNSNSSSSSSSSECRCHRDSEPPYTLNEYSVLFRSYAGSLIGFMAAGAKEVALVTAEGITNVAIDATIGSILNGVAGMVSGAITGIAKTSAKLLWRGTVATGSLLWWVVSSSLTSATSAQTSPDNSEAEAIAQNTPYSSSARIACASSSRADSLDIRGSSQPPSLRPSDAQHMGTVDRYPEGFVAHAGHACRDACTQTDLVEYRTRDGHRMASAKKKKEDAAKLARGDGATEAQLIASTATDAEAEVEAEESGRFAALSSSVSSSIRQHFNRLGGPRERPQGGEHESLVEVPAIPRGPSIVLSEMDPIDDIVSISSHKPSAPPPMRK